LQFTPANIYHVYNEGNNHELLFREPSDYITFLKLYRRSIIPFASTLAWCLMPMYFDFMLHTDLRCAKKQKQGGLFLDPVTNGFRKLLSGYARHINKKYFRAGSLFRQKTKSDRITDNEPRAGSNIYERERLIDVFNQVHIKPLVAGQVERLEDWEFSSYRDFAGLRDGTLCRKDLAEQYCGYEKDVFCQQTLDHISQKKFRLIFNFDQTDPV
jgi:putative transposase